jgi:predicted SprT family Zn-dependent metalloprotease
MAKRLMAQHGLDDWTFRFDNSKVRFGQARRGEYRGEFIQEITISRAITEKAKPSVVKDTILHEIAHALVGVEHHHDAIWKAKAMELGVAPNVYSDDEAELVAELAPYKYRCVECYDRLWHSHRPKSTVGIGCPKHPDARVVRLHNEEPDVHLC